MYSSQCILHTMYTSPFAPFGRCCCGLGCSSMGAGFRAMRVPRRAPSVVCASPAPSTWLCPGYYYVTVSGLAGGISCVHAGRFDPSKGGQCVNSVAQLGGHADARLCNKYIVYLVHMSVCIPDSAITKCERWTEAGTETGMPLRCIADSVGRGAGCRPWTQS